MICPNSAVFVMATSCSTIEHDTVSTVNSSTGKNDTPTEEVPDEIESDDDYTGGLFD